MPRAAHGILAEEAMALVERARPIFAGQPSGAVGAALADLLAIWLASHRVEGDEDAQRSLWADMLAEHCVTVRRLTEINAEKLAARRTKH